MNRLIIISFLVTACNNTEINKLGETREGLPDAESWNAIITLTNEGSKRAIIKSGHLEKLYLRLRDLFKECYDESFSRSVRSKYSEEDLSEYIRIATVEHQSRLLMMSLSDELRLLPVTYMEIY